MRLLKTKKRKENKFITLRAPAEAISVYCSLMAGASSQVETDPQFTASRNMCWRIHKTYLFHIGQVCFNYLPLCYIQRIVNLSLAFGDWFGCSLYFIYVVIMHITIYLGVLLVIQQAKASRIVKTSPQLTPSRNTRWPSPCVLA